MKKHLVFLGCTLVIFSIISCQITNAIVQNESPFQDQESETLSSSNNLTDEPVSNDLLTEEPEMIQIIPVQHLSEIPNDVNLSGVIVTGQNGAAFPDFESMYFIDSRTGQQDLQQESGKMAESVTSSFSVSPDKTMAAYFFKSSIGRSLIIVDNTGEMIFQLPILNEKGEYLQQELIPGNVNWSESIYWLDNETLVFEKWPIDMSSMDLRPRSLIVYKPFSGSIREFPRNYPNISETLNYSVDWQNGGYSGMGLDPTMRRLVYATDNSQIILWDIRNNKKIDEYSGIFNIGGPVWTDDGTFFYMAKGLLDFSTQTTQLEINQISQDGKLFELTNLNEIIKNYHMPYLVLSPDHQKLAFQIITDEVLCDDPWAKGFPTILNLTPPYQVTIFCIPFSMNGIPIWSPNSQFLLLQSSDPKKLTSEFTTLLAIEDEYIVEFTQDTVPLGWMINQ